jgi:hypothetical protein
MSVFMSVKLLWALINCAESPERREKGRQERKAGVFVMFMKKFRQLLDEKFCPRSESNACGKGVGRGGGEEGMVGRL